MTGRAAPQQYCQTPGAGRVHISASSASNLFPLLLHCYGEGVVSHCQLRQELMTLMSVTFCICFPVFRLGFCEIWEGKGLLAFVDPYNVLALVAAPSLLGGCLWEVKALPHRIPSSLFTDHHGFS